MNEKTFLFRKNSPYVLYSTSMAQKFCELRIKAIVLHRKTHEPSAVLQDTTDLRMVTVPVDLGDAGALMAGAAQVESGLPFPQNAVCELFAEHGFVAEGLLLRPGRQNRFETVLRYHAGRKQHEINVRAGEGLSLSLYFEVPVMMSNEDLAACGTCGLPGSLDYFSQEVVLLDSPFAHRT